jgi:hypothetical protein
MIVDCDGCAVRGHGCADCVVSVLMGGPPDVVELDADEQRAIAALSAGGLVPPLRLLPVRPVTPSERTRTPRRAVG